jgi:hypothetical protein
MKKDAMGKMRLSKETLRALDAGKLAEAAGGITTAQTDVSGACTRQPACGTSHNTCTSQFC